MRRSRAGARRRPIWRWPAAISPRNSASICRSRWLAEGACGSRKRTRRERARRRPASSRRNGSGGTRSAPACRGRAGRTRSASTSLLSAIHSRSIRATATTSHCGSGISGRGRRTRTRSCSLARRCTRRRCASRIRAAGDGCGWSRRSRTTSHAASTCSAPPAATPYRERALSLAVDERLYVGLEGDLDLVAPDLLHQPDAEGWVLDDFLGNVFLPGGVLAGAGHVLASEKRLPAGDGRPCLAPVADFARFPGALPRLGAGGAAVVVLALAGIAADAHGLAADHRQDGVSQVHLAARAPRVDVAADLPSRRHGKADLKSQCGEGARRFA